MEKSSNSSVSVSITFAGPKGFHLLTQCIESVLHQTVLPEEIVLVGTKDDVGKLEAHFTEKYKKIMQFVVFQGEKNAARNQGILHSKGKYILFLDYDMIASKDLIENCLQLAKKNKAIIIPEQGSGGSFWENCRKLEKELITYDIHTVTPRFYEKNIFARSEQPFDSKFGLLDEWGFNQKLSKKKVAVGFSSGFLTVKELDLTLGAEIKNKFTRGLWMRNFYQTDKEEAWSRINPIQRGILFYGKNVRYIIKEPIYFPGLIVLKFVDFISFMSGYLVGYMTKNNF